MIDEIIALAGMFGMTGIGAAVYYKLGRMEEKVDFIYKACNIEMSFKIKPKQMETDCNGLGNTGNIGAHRHRRKR